MHCCFYADGFAVAGGACGRVWCRWSVYGLFVYIIEKKRAPVGGWGRLSRTVEYDAPLPGHFQLLVFLARIVEFFHLPDD